MNSRQASPGRDRAYYLRAIPSHLWEPVLAKARAEGRSVRWVILQALRDWLDGRYEPTRREHPEAFRGPGAPTAGPQDGP
jgi:hypothetical protein